MIHDTDLLCIPQSWTISVHTGLATKAPVDPRLPILVGKTTTEENGTDDPTLHVHMTATGGAPILTQTLTNLNADGRTVQP